MPFDRSQARVVALFFAAMFLQACSSLVIHDDARAKLSSDSKASYVDAKVSAVVEADGKNLGSMLAAELEVVRENARYEADWASLSLANDTTPMGKTVHMSKERIQKLGFASGAELRKAKDTLVDLEIEQRKLKNSRKALAKIQISDCKTDMPKLPTIPDGVPDLEKASLQKNYAGYYKQCQDFLALKINASGALGNAHDKWLTAQIAQESAESAQKTALAKLKLAKVAFEKKVAEVAAAAKNGQDLSKEIADKAQDFADVVKDAKKLDKGLEGEPYIDALVDLLTATAGGDVDPKHPSVQRAAAVAQQIPSLAGDMAALEAKRTAPPVSGLLIELRHQTLQAEMAKRRAALAAERVAILKVKYEVYLQTAERWLSFLDATCNYAVLGAARKHPSGDACDLQFSVKAVTANVDTVECNYEGAKLNNCWLEQSWKDRWRATEAPATKRQLYDAVAAYLQAITLQQRSLEQSFKEIDVRHRETLLAKKTAIDQWDNLVSVSLDQLEAYYSAGVKPAEIADLIIKALGFTAIAIGVSK